MGVYQREGKRTGWYWDFRFGRKRYRGWAGPKSTKEQAQRLEAKKMRELDEGLIVAPKAPPVTFIAFAEDFLVTDSPTKRSKSRDRGILEMLKAGAEDWPGWKSLNLSDITAKMIEDFKARRLKYRSPATVNKEIQVIKRLFRVAVEWKKLRENPAAGVRKLVVDNTRVRFLEPDELGRLLRALPDWLLPYAVFAWKSGARRGEILGLTWNDVDFKRGLLTFRDTKTGKNQTVVMNRTVRALLEDLPAPRDRSQRVFPRPAGALNESSFLVTIDRAWKDACRKARIGAACGCQKRTADQKPEEKCRYCRGTGISPDFRFHDLRHQAATDLLTAGRTLNDVRDFLRHRTPAMTLRYAHLVESRREETAYALDQAAVVPQADRGRGPIPQVWRPQRDSNPCYRLERAMS